ncbi:MAG TPA: hypothetical protein VEX18_14105, partial [Polyangiaceae bacterium]|nr:hypothetical protein [Polyangiaceae bacterium]
MSRRPLSLLAAFACLCGCEAARSSGAAAERAGPAKVAAPSHAPQPSSSAFVLAPAPPRPQPSPSPTKVEMKEEAMGTSLHFIAYTSARADETATRAAMAKAVSEIRRLEALLS